MVLKSIQCCRPGLAPIPLEIPAPLNAQNRTCSGGAKLMIASSCGFSPSNRMLGRLPNLVRASEPAFEPSAPFVLKGKEAED